MDSQFFHAKPHQLRRRREASGTFLHPEENARSMFSDNSMDFFKECEELNWKHERPTPRRSETNGIAERPVRRVKEGTSSVLVQSGLQESWWAETMGCCCYLRDVQDQSLQMARHLMNVGSIHRLKGRLFRLEQK